MKYRGCYGECRPWRREQRLQRLGTGYGLGMGVLWCLCGVWAWAECWGTGVAW